LPFQVSFIPEQDHLAAVVRDIRASQHAFPLPEVAHRFLHSPEWHSVKLEAERPEQGKPGPQLFQSKVSGRVFVRREAAEAAVVDELLAERFEVEEVPQDPPSGQFVCVGRCRLSGELLGPPNYHGYTQRVEELHRTRFAQMTLDAYRREIETVRDPELIEAWKQQCSTRTVYRLKSAGGEQAVAVKATESEATDSEGTDSEATAAEEMDVRAARAYVQEQLLPRAVVAVHRAVIPGPASRELTDPALLGLLRSAWGREQQMPLTLMRALRSAFRHMGLHVFNAGKGRRFVTAIAPRPLGAARVIETIQPTLDWLREHPGQSRHDLVAALRPGTESDPALLAEVLQPLRWLIEKGHVIEFYDGTLAVPRGG
jgi:hypothetical protein